MAEVTEEGFSAGYSTVPFPDALLSAFCLLVCWSLICTGKGLFPVKISFQCTCPGVRSGVCGTFALAEAQCTFVEGKTSIFSQENRLYPCFMNFVFIIYMGGTSLG